MMYAMKNKDKKHQTASPDKYPQGYFKDKPCRECGTMFSSKAPAEHYCSDRCKDRALTSAYLKRTYGITLSDYERMYAEQSGRCKICGGEGFVMDKNKHSVKLVVDHCHAMGKVRGLLCHNCNRALGLLKDNIQSLENAIAYLKV